MNPVFDHVVLGIDYGTKRMGLAIMCPGSNLAFPHSVVVNDKNLISELKNIIEENQVGIAVIGESKNLDGQDNILMTDIRKFAEKLRQEFPELKLEFEPEHYTSFEAERYLGKHAKVDASAASIILQSWADRNRKS